MMIFVIAGLESWGLRRVGVANDGPDSWGVREVRGCAWKDRRSPGGGDKFSSYRHLQRGCAKPLYLLLTRLHDQNEENLSSVGNDCSP